MTTNTEQAFFEVWGIEPIKLPKCPSCGYYLGCPDRINNHMDKVCVYDRFISCAHCSACVDKEDAGDYYEYINPAITPERVLALEEILIKKYGDINVNTIAGKYSYACGVDAFGAYDSHHIGDLGKTRPDALLSLLTQLKPELSEEVQEEVKAVFG